MIAKKLEGSLFEVTVLPTELGPSTHQVFKFDGIAHEVIEIIKYAESALGHGIEVSIVRARKI